MPNPAHKAPADAFNDDEEDGRHAKKRGKRGKKDGQDGQDGGIDLDQIQEHGVDPDAVYFTHARIRKQFSCGRYVEDTIQDLLVGKISIGDLPRITIILSHGALFSMNNRRLYVLKELRRLGHLAPTQNRVPVRTMPVLETKRLKDKYLPEVCTKSARFL